MAKEKIQTVTLTIDEATTLVIDGVEYSGTVTVPQTIADEILKSNRAVINQEEITTDGITGNE